MLRKKCAMILSVFAISLGLSAEMANAAPVSNVPTSVTQPNGEVLELFASGDEYFNYLHDANGHIIIKNGETGYYTYAEIENQCVVPGNIPVTNTSPSDPGGSSPAPIPTIYFEDIPQDYIQNRYENSPLNEDTISTLSVEDGLVNDRAPHPFLNKTVNNLVILIDFPDQGFTSANVRETLETVLNTGEESLKNWFETASYGKTSVVSHVYPTSEGTALATYTDIYPRTTYVADHQNVYGNDVYMLNGEEISRAELEHGLLKRAIAAVSSQIPETLNLDADGDGSVDSVTFIVAGQSIPWNTLLWSHKWGLSGSTSINGKRVGNYAFVMEDYILKNTGSCSTIAHEMFHVYGAPDLYSYIGNPNKVGCWDIMASGSRQMTSSYMKYKYGGWIDEIPEIKEEASYTLNKCTIPENSCYMLRSPYSAQEFFVVEYRKKEAPFENLVRGDGIVIYRINARATGNSYANSSTTPEEIFVAASNPSMVYYPQYDDEANLTLRDGTSAGIKLDRFRLSGDTASFRVSFSYQKLMNRFLDPRLAEAICTALDKTSEEITEQDLAGITSLSLNAVRTYDLPIDLTGIEGLTNLQTLILNNCKINDISPLQTLTNLTHLELVNNNIEDFSPLGELSSLTYLKLRGNISGDYSPLSGIYGSLLSKDFSLDGKNDIVFKISEMNPQQNVRTVTIQKSNTVPQTIRIIAEKYSADGTLLHTRKFSNFNLIPRNPSFQLSSDFHCRDGGYLVISAYERQNETKLIARTTVKAITFQTTMLKE